MKGIGIEPQIQQPVIDVLNQFIGGGEKGTDSTPL